MKEEFERMKKNHINWGVHDTQEIMDLIDGIGYMNEGTEKYDGRLSQIVAPEHPDGLVIPCTFCDDMDGTPEYCEGVKWQLDDGLEGLYSSCDWQLQKGIDEMADEIHDMDMIEWIQRVEPANFKVIEANRDYVMRNGISARLGRKKN